MAYLCGSLCTTMRRPCLFLRRRGQLGGRGAKGFHHFLSVSPAPQNSSSGDWTRWVQLTGTIDQRWDISYWSFQHAVGAGSKCQKSHPRQGARDKMGDWFSLWLSEGEGRMRTWRVKAGVRRGESRSQDIYKEKRRGLWRETGRL